MLEGSLEDVCEGRPETEEAETRTNQIESKNGNLKDSEPDGCCNIRSSGISRSTHVIGPRRREEAPTIKGGDFLPVGGEGNRNTMAYTTIPDHNIQSTEQGMAQALRAGEHLHRVIGSDGCSPDWWVQFYMSPYART
ncbi:Phosphoglycerate mutase-like protein AT74 [Glycine max]|nr:Phosphoglycerate mutase-like protein AT74 [Glycine max]